MNTRVLTVDPEDPSPTDVREAARVLLDGGTVAFPTETVYGLGALADEAECVLKIFAAKSRPAHNPMIVHVHDIASARALADPWPALADSLAREFWPGPLTLVVPRNSKAIPDEVTAGGASVAVRVPAHPVALALLRELGRPIAAPSANRSQSLSPTTAAHVLKSLGGRIDMVLDCGPCALGIESTVLDIRASAPVILRPGALDLARLRALLPDLCERPRGTDSSPLPSPGMLNRHYAPRARLSVTPLDEIFGRAFGATLTFPVGVITMLPDARLLALAGVHPMALGDSPELFARALFAALHHLDELGCATIIVAELPDEPAWAAVRDRLGRASCL